MFKTLMKSGSGAARGHCALVGTGVRKPTITAGAEQHRHASIK